jgi:Protein of unknown function, DUF485
MIRPVPPVSAQLRALDAARLADRDHPDDHDDRHLRRLHPADRLRQATPGDAIAEGLSLGILLGALVIVSAWLLIAIYVRWANRHYDTALAAIRHQAGPR